MPRTSAPSPRPRPHAPAAARALAAAIGVCAASALALSPLAGCGSYTIYPEVPGQYVEADPNTTPVVEVTRKSLAWVIEHYPVGLANTGAGLQIAVNPPPGMLPKNTAKILADLGPGVVLYGPDTASLPTYHVGRVTVRGLEGRVEIFRPVFRAAASQGPLDGSAHQPVSVRLTGTFNRWRVEQTIPRAPGSLPLPPHADPEVAEAARRAADPANKNPSKNPAQPPVDSPVEPLLEPTTEPSVDSDAAPTAEPLPLPPLPPEDPVEPLPPDDGRDNPYITPDAWQPPR